MSNISYYTQEGLKKLQDDLHEMKVSERARIATQIAEARDKGDLTENAEYDAAKDAQGMLERRISKMEELLANARVIDNSRMDPSRALVLSTVKIQNLQNKQQMSYTLVAETEADMKKGKLSVTSPIGKALLGKPAGATVEIAVPSGTVKFKILEISR